jgi:hypothetical protein
MKNWQKFSRERELLFGAVILLVGALLCAARLPGAAVQPAAAAAQAPLYADPAGQCGGNTPCYTSLQAAVDAAPEQGTVLAYGGFYPESLALQRAVTVTCLEELTLGGFNQSAGSFSAPPGMLTMQGDFIRSGGSYQANAGLLFFEQGEGGLQAPELRVANKYAPAFIPTTYDLDLQVPTNFQALGVAPFVMLVEVQPDDHALLAGVLVNQGVIRKTLSVAGAGLLSFGLAGAQVQVTAPGSLSALQVDLVGESSPWAPPALENGAYWIFTPTGSGYTLDLTLVHSSATTANDKACRSLGLWWDCAASSFNAPAHTVTRTGVTQLSQWAVGPLSQALLPLALGEKINE